MEKKWDTVILADLKILFVSGKYSSIAHGIICTQLLCGKMHSDWLNEIKMLQVRRQHGEKMGYCYPSGLENTLCKWDIVHVPLVTKWLRCSIKCSITSVMKQFKIMDVNASKISLLAEKRRPRLIMLQLGSLSG
jgi:hypothetical protein